MTRGFDRQLLPEPLTYYMQHLEQLKMRHLRATSKCPFHGDDRPSFAVNLQTGAYNCFACGERGKDVLDFHKRMFCQGFVQAAKELGAWR